jgi:hypothetical protein
MDPTSRWLGALTGDLRADGDFLDRLENDLAGRQQTDWTSEFERYLVIYRALPVA